MARGSTLWPPYPSCDRTVFSLDMIRRRPRIFEPRTAICSAAKCCHHRLYAGAGIHTTRLGVARTGALLGAGRPVSSHRRSTHTYTSELEQSLDLRAPATWYPLARQRQRRVIFHAGPTNSGKTHAALVALRAASTGVYCGPLRLLAWEVHSRLNADGTPCGLRTGQETKDVAGAAHVSCTVEMTDTETRYAVGVLDEIQMLADETRGWAWTRALLGLAVDELHCCGDPSAGPLLSRLCETAGDTFEVVEYERLSPLEISPNAVHQLEGVQGGDCVIAFSRRQLYTLRAQIELASAGEIQCGLVYGRLPPNSRRGQAAWFNGSREQDDQRALVATDAIGMGLNLNIKRVVFTTLEKYDGSQRRRLTPAEIKQIAGRAGRYGSDHAHGQVTCLRGEDMDYLEKALASPPEALSRAGLAPTSEQLRHFVSLRAPHSWVSPVVTVDLDGDGEAKEQRFEDVDHASTDIGDDEDEEDAVFAEVMATDPAAYNFACTEGAKSFDEDDEYSSICTSDDDSGNDSGYGGGTCYDDNDENDDDELYRDYIDSLFDDADDSKQYQCDDSDFDSFDGAPRFYSHSPEDSAVLFSALIEEYFRRVRVDRSLFFVADASDTCRAAAIIDDIPMPLHSRYIFALAPVESHEPFAAAMLHRFAKHFSDGGWVDLGLDLKDTGDEDADDEGVEYGAQKRKHMSDRVKNIPKSPGQLHELEVVHSVIDVYLWLATRFQHEFDDVDVAHEQAKIAQERIESGIKALAVDPAAIRDAYRNKAGAKRLESILRATSALPRRRKKQNQQQWRAKKAKKGERGGASSSSSSKHRFDWADEDWDNEYSDGQVKNARRSGRRKNRRPSRRSRSKKRRVR